MLKPIHYSIRWPRRLYSSFILATALSWSLVVAMPVINAHGQSAGVWATLCTINGFELVQVEEGHSIKPHGKPCPFGHFTYLEIGSISPVVIDRVVTLSTAFSTTILTLSSRYKSAFPRAPPYSSSIQ
ncbi:hypothetical protein [Vibrio sp. LaRot3]|uniref:hypothetical protein n=1 Tax=Vibrio sp. LaRot3 TaxID=2998829 RepID=UPI0022CE0AFE|nr:hypothetical protein [Vibrio sp. LaRot3]MDA0149613.1 hypothetical protein [Vibrio sp. LaRot3]